MLHCKFELCVIDHVPNLSSVSLTMQEAEALGTGYMGSPGSAGDDVMKEVILLAACGAGEVLPQSPDLPADVFTACLTTPIKVRPHCNVAEHLSASAPTTPPARCCRFYCLSHGVSGWIPIGCARSQVALGCFCPVLAT